MVPVAEMSRLSRVEALPAPEGYEVLLDRKQGKIWINGPDGGAVGRFNQRTGIDIHRSTEEQMAGLGQCLHCTRGKPTKSDWEFFVSQANALWGVVLPFDCFPVD